jgi:hypothetical protein
VQRGPAAEMTCARSPFICTRAVRGASQVANTLWACATMGRDGAGGAARVKAIDSGSASSRNDKQRAAGDAQSGIRRTRLGGGNVLNFNRGRLLMRLSCAALQVSERTWQKMKVA